MVPTSTYPPDVLDFSCLPASELVDLAHGWLESGRALAHVHPLGFVHVDLSRALGLVWPWRIRLHLWEGYPERRRDGLGVLHDHSWNLYSRILIGELENRTYDFNPDNSGNAYLGMLAYTGDHEALISCTRGRFSRKSSLAVTIGERYELPSGVLHKTLVKGLPLATVVISQEQTADRIARVQLIPEVEWRSVPRQPCPLARILPAMNRLREFLSQDVLSQEVKYG
jgi:hypothetical protein